MARKLRLTFPGARYHVYNRGNYRNDIFATDGARRAFEDCLFEAAAQFGWILHAYVIMINHFHLALETPQGNLREGMHWLLSTFATRFNRFREEHGHVFQGRYHAKLVESFVNLANYIHLNPVRAQIVPVADLAAYRWSSYPRFNGGQRPDFLTCEWMNDLGGLQDSPSGWRSYADYLAVLAADAEGQKRQGFEKMCRGWAIGTQEWKTATAEAHADKLVELRKNGSEIGELKEEIWAKQLDALLASLGKTRADAASGKRGASWKIELAAELRENSGAANAWIARELFMGCRSSVSVYLSQRRRKFKI